MRPIFTWNLGKRSLELGKRTLVMGILNVTPDSFSDGGEHFSTDAALKHGLRLLSEGADILDIGGESTRPGSRVGLENPSVSADEELKRVLPVITAIKKANPTAFVSIDTYKAPVARAAVEAGAEIVNDVSGLTWDTQMKDVLSPLTCGVVLMHTRGRPDEWKSLPPVADMVVLVKRDLGKLAETAVRAGIRRDRILLDPGFGFGKRYEENYPLLRRFEVFHELRYPLLTGVSRKSFIGRVLAENNGEEDSHNERPINERLFGSLGAETVLAIKGAHVIRTHNVKASVEALKLADVVSG